MTEAYTSIDKLELIRKSHICEAYTPSSPVTHNFFCGRETEVEKILTSIVSSKSHILLYGDRGVGKTSLAQYASGIMVEQSYKRKNIEYRCGKDDTSGTVMQGVFQKLGIAVVENRSSSSYASGDMKFVVSLTVQSKK